MFLPLHTRTHTHVHAHPRTHTRTYTRTYTRTLAVVVDLPTGAEDELLEGAVFVLEVLEGRAEVHDDRGDEDDARERRRHVAQDVDKDEDEELAVQDHEVPHLTRERKT